MGYCATTRTLVAGVGDPLAGGGRRAVRVHQLRLAAGHKQHRPHVMQRLHEAAPRHLSSGSD